MSTQQGVSEIPYTLEVEGEGRFRVRGEHGFIGLVLGGGRRWIAECGGKQAGPFRTRADAALAVFCEYELTQGEARSG